MCAKRSLMFTNLYTMQFGRLNWTKPNRALFKPLQETFWRYLTMRWSTKHLVAHQHAGKEHVRLCYFSRGTGWFLDIGCVSTALCVIARRTIFPSSVHRSAFSVLLLFFLFKCVQWVLNESCALMAFYTFLIWIEKRKPKQNGLQYHCDCQVIT